MMFGPVAALVCLELLAVAVAQQVTKPTCPPGYLECDLGGDQGTQCVQKTIPGLISKTTNLPCKAYCPFPAATTTEIQCSSEYGRDGCPLPPVKVQLDSPCPAGRYDMDGQPICGGDDQRCPGSNGGLDFCYPTYRSAAGPGKPAAKRCPAFCPSANAPHGAYLCPKTYDPSGCENAPEYRPTPEACPKSAHDQNGCQLPYCQSADRFECTVTVAPHGAPWAQGHPAAAKSCPPRNILCKQRRTGKDGRRCDTLCPAPGGCPPNYDSNGCEVRQQRTAGGTCPPRTIDEFGCDVSPCASDEVECFDPARAPNNCAVKSARCRKASKPGCPNLCPFYDSAAALFECPLAKDTSGCPKRQIFVVGQAECSKYKGFDHRDCPILQCRPDQKQCPLVGPQQYCPRSVCSPRFTILNGKQCPYPCSPPQLPGTVPCPIDHDAAGCPRVQMYRATPVECPRPTTDANGCFVRPPLQCGPLDQVCPGGIAADGCHLASTCSPIASCCPTPQIPSVLTPRGK